MRVVVLERGMVFTFRLLRQREPAGQEVGVLVGVGEQLFPAPFHHGL